MKRFHIITFGCQMNVHDSERIAGILQSEGCVPTTEASRADIVVFNTCSIRQKAEQKFLSRLGRISSLKRKNPGMVIVVAGCVAEQDGAHLLRRGFPVDYVVGPRNITVFRDIARGDLGNPLHVGESPPADDTDMPVARQNNVRAWVTVMHGCDNFCSYCVVPYTRGREKSRDAALILREIRDLSSKGIKEVCLLGQNVNSYKSSLTFPDLLREINGIDGIERVRFVTSHPKDLSDNLITAIAELPKVCEHIHLPLQSGSTEILRLMNRQYTYEQYQEKIIRLRNSVQNISITSDIITGFPQETDEDHRATLDALQEIRFDGVFAFAFSPRPNTPAAAMKGLVPESIRHERLGQVLSLQDRITEERNALLQSSSVEVLVDDRANEGQGPHTGRTRGNKKVVISDALSPLRIGDVVNVLISKARRHCLEGVIR